MRRYDRSACFFFLYQIRVAAKSSVISVMMIIRVEDKKPDSW